MIARHTVFLFAAALTACQQAPAERKPAQKTQTFDYQDEILPMVVDHETGCQYLGYSGHGLTPRLVWDEKRQEMGVMGCRIVEHETLTSP